MERKKEKIAGKVKVNEIQQDGWTFQVIFSKKDGKVDFFYSPVFDRYQLIGILEVEIERLKKEMIEEIERLKKEMGKKATKHG